MCVSAFCHILVEKNHLFWYISTTTYIFILKTNMIFIQQITYHETCTFSFFRIRYCHCNFDGLKCTFKLIHQLVFAFAYNIDLSNQFLVNLSFFSFSLFYILRRRFYVFLLDTFKTYLSLENGYTLYFEELYVQTFFNSVSS